MSKRIRVFEAPGGEAATLPIKPSMWHSERSAYIPLDHWLLILEFVREIMPGKADFLENMTFGSYKYNYYLNLSKSEQTSIIDLLYSVQDKLRNSPSILSLKDRVDDFYDEFENEEYCKMIEAVIAVYEEARRLQSPVCVYND
ncbi:hypothetical protein [Hahella sp. HN01]|uniref:hypothetical protein n=1 Tax=Hahella sp. HN01 TaxID=2847262 RepID=UPI001C1EA01B|nr:hypothetical protein [Hahella sp. HN01]MBU6955964.1 hypothetical protein [Hahella sp. HN01]